MYKCDKCKKQIGKKIPQAKIIHYKSDGNIKSEEKVCFPCKDKSKEEGGKK